MARRFLPATPEKLTDAAQENAEMDHPVASTAINNLRYNFITDELEVFFQDGSVYSYSGIDPTTFTGLMRAGSKGGYFNSVIRNSYSFSRVG
jgi:hypothetical protein